MEHVAIPPAFLDISCVSLEHLGLLGLAHVVVDVSELNFPEALERRAVRVAFFIGERMVLPMNSHPLLGGKPRRDPECELETKDKGRMKFKRFMGGCAMEVDGGTEDGDLNKNDGDNKCDKKRNEHYTLLRETSWEQTCDSNTAS